MSCNVSSVFFREMQMGLKNYSAIKAVRERVIFYKDTDFFDAGGQKSEVGCQKSDVRGLRFPVLMEFEKL